MVRQRVHRFVALTQRRKRTAGRSVIDQLELERQRLSRQLHTGVGQTLAATRLQLELAQLGNPPAAVEQALHRAFTLLDEAIAQVRSVATWLYPPEWQRLTLAQALQQLWEISGIPEKFHPSLRIQPPPEDPGPLMKALIYRGAQEALSNIVRHSRAASVDLALEVRAARLVLTVRDDGVGFDAGRLFSDPPSPASGIGLRSIREEAASLGGRLFVRSGPDGTTLEVSVPLSESSARSA